MPARHEAGLEDRFPRRDVFRAAASRGNSAERIAGSFQFLNEVGTEATATKRFVHPHVDVAIGRIVVKRDAAFANLGAVQFQNPLTAAVAARNKSDLRLQT